MGKNLGSIYFLEYLVQIIGSAGFFRLLDTNKKLSLVFLGLYFLGLGLMLYHNYKLLDRTNIYYLNTDIIFVILVMGIPRLIKIGYGLEILLMVIISMLYAYFMAKDKEKEIVKLG